MIIVEAWVVRAGVTPAQCDRGMAHIWVNEEDPTRARRAAESHLAREGWAVQAEEEVRVLRLRKPEHWTDLDAQRSWQLAEQYGLWPNLHLYPRESDNPDPLS